MSETATQVRAYADAMNPNELTGTAFQVEAAHWMREAASEIERLHEAIREERRWATGTAEHNDARSALYALLPEHPSRV